MMSREHHCLDITSPRTLFIGIVVMIFLSCCFSPITASCMKNGKTKCCNGTDSNCYDIYMVRHQLVRCYCDRACLKRKNCCWDYPLACLDDCITSEWSLWDSCSNDCGQGLEKRTRTVIKSPRSKKNKPCPILEETRFCESYHCPAKSQIVSTAIRRKIISQETAQLLPMIANVQTLLSRFDATPDNLRRHLMMKRNMQRMTRPVALQYKQHQQHQQSQTLIANITSQSNKMPYCAIFRVVNASESCSPILKSKWHQKLSHLRRFFSNVDVQSSAANSSSDHSFSMWRRHVNTLRRGSRVCVTCFEHYMHRSQEEMRCPGSGLTSKATKWRTTIIPQCNGHFQLLTTSKGCTCPADSANSFMFQ